MAVVSRICRNGHYVKGTGECPSCAPSPDRLSRKYASVQIGMIDGETEGYFPKGSGPYVDYPRSLKRRVKNKHAWKEFIKGTEGKIEDAS